MADELLSVMYESSASTESTQLAERVGIDCRVKSYPKCHVFFGYGNFELQKAVNRLVRHSEDTSKNFQLLFGTTPQENSTLRRIHEDAVASVFGAEISKQDRQPDTDTTRSLWCDDRPYKMADNVSVHPAPAPVARRRTKKLLLSAVHTIHGLHYIKHKTKAVPAIRIQSSPDHVQRNMKISPTSVADTAGPFNARNKTPASKNLPPLPKHLPWSAGTSFTPAGGNTFDMVVSLLTGTSSTGAANASQLRKLIPDGPHDRDDVFLSCIF